MGTDERTRDDSSSGLSDDAEIRGYAPLRQARLLALVTLVVAVLAVVIAVAPILERPRVTADDYRYLDNVARLQQDGLATIPGTLVVENGWNHLWWMDTGEPIRFFRPTVVLSYLLDVVLYTNVVRGLTVTNIFLHLLCVVLFMGLLKSLRLGGLPAFLATMLFALFACHSEALWYPAGRTDTLAAAGFLGALLAYVGGGRGRPLWTVASVAIFGLALITKELVISLPVMCLLFEVWVWRRTSLRDVLSRRKGAYLGYVGVVALYLIVRRWALSGGTGWVFPYMVSPFSEGFPGHVWAQVRSYLENLFVAEETIPFTQYSELGDRTTIWGFVLACAAVVLLCVAVGRSRRGWFLLAMGMATWAPTSVVYLSERYLYLPSAALAAIVALTLARVFRHRLIRSGLLVLVLSWTIHQGWSLHSRNQFIATVAYRSAETANRLLAPLRSRIEHDKMILILDFPFNWLTTQFAGQVTRVGLENATVQVRVLTHSPLRAGPDSRLHLSRERQNTLRIRRSSSLTYRRLSLFPWIKCEPGTVVSRDELPFEATVRDGAGETCREVEFRFDRPLEDYTFVWFQHTTGRVVDGHFKILDVPPALEKKE